VVPIEFPASDLSTDQKKLARWYNFFDPDDVLGYLLKPLSSGYDKVVNAGIPINVGRLLSSWYPASHTQYWTDDSFTKPVVKFLMEFLRGKPRSRAGLVIEVIRRCTKQQSGLFGPEYRYLRGCEPGGPRSSDAVDHAVENWRWIGELKSTNPWSMLDL
jgi:hypothetical protein